MYLYWFFTSVGWNHFILTYWIWVFHSVMVKLTGSWVRTPLWTIRHCAVAMSIFNIDKKYVCKCPFLTLRREMATGNVSHYSSRNIEFNSTHVPAPGRYYPLDTLRKWPASCILAKCNSPLYNKSFVIAKGVIYLNT